MLPLERAILSRIQSGKDKKSSKHESCDPVQVHFHFTANLKYTLTIMSLYEWLYGCAT